MTKYLSMNGTSDWLEVPSLTFSKVTMDMVLSESKGTLVNLAGSIIQWGGTYWNNGSNDLRVKIDGTSLSGQPYNMTLPLNQRMSVEVTTTATNKTGTSFILSRREDSYSVDSGKIYDIKIYNDTTLVAHYDMSTGTVNDQTGNGYNATLTGGTWLDDGSGGNPTGNAYTASLSDSMSFSDNINKLYKGYKTVSDSISTSDFISRNLTILVVDNIASGDTTNESKGKNQDLTDSIILLDSISKHLVRSLSDSILTSETSEKDKYKSFNDTISPQDTLNQSSQFYKQLSDSMSFLDSITTYQGKAINLYDSISIVDAISKSLNRHVNDFVSSGDGEKYVTDKTLLDAISSSDIITTNEGKSILLSDSVNLSDAINKALSQIKLDSIGTTDEYTQQSHVNLQLYDVIVTTDTLNVHLPNAPTLIGTIELQGKRELNIYLTGTRQLDLNFKGVIQ